MAKVDGWGKQKKHRQKAVAEFLFAAAFAIFLLFYFVIVEFSL
jgi:hypothetical protein